MLEHGLQIGANAVWIRTGAPILSEAVIARVDRACPLSICIRLDELDEINWPKGQPRLIITTHRQASRLVEHYGPQWAQAASSRTVLLEESARRNSSMLANRPKYRISITESASRIERLIARAWREANPSEIPRARSRIGFRTLTTRERRLFGFIAGGVALKVAAAQLGISYKTADTRRTNIYRKLNIKRACEAIMLAIQEGLIQDAAPVTAADEAAADTKLAAEAATPSKR